MKLSVNIHGQNIPDKPRLYSFLEKIKPSWALVMDEMDVVREIKRILPSCNVIFRAWPDDKLVEVDPAHWVNTAKLVVGDTDAWAYAGNEIGFSDVALNWSCAVIEAAVKIGLRVVVGNFSAGTPEPADWERPAAKRLLTLLDTHRQFAVLGLHEYACGIITSGILNPPQTHPLLWPRNITGLNLWHLGRYTFLVRACQKMNIPLPRLVITEFGFDDMSDVATWRDTLVKTPPFANIRGWKTLVNQWQQWGNWLTPQQALYEQYLYANDVFYTHPAVEGILIYCWGASSDEWKPFDVSDALEFQDLMTQTTITRPPIPKPGRYIISKTDKGMNVRDEARVGSHIQATLQTGQRLTVLPVDPRKDDQYDWVMVDGVAIVTDEKNPLSTKIVNFHGWSAITTATDFKPDVEPVPTEPPPAPVVLTPDETDILDTLTAACEKFMALPTQNPDSWREFKTLVHLAQNMVMARPVERILAVK